MEATSFHKRKERVKTSRGHKLQKKNNLFPCPLSPLLDELKQVVPHYLVFACTGSWVSGSGTVLAVTLSSVYSFTDSHALGVNP